jgi:hypothetical protein
LLRKLREAYEDIINLPDGLIRYTDDGDSIVRVTGINARYTGIRTEPHSNGEAGCIVL